MEPTQIPDSISSETQRILTEMGKTKDLEQRRLQSEIVFNLCKSLGVFFDMMSNAMLSDIPDVFESDED